ncbi:TPA: hypothetical protein ACHUV2_004256, partial [Shigella sonnei]
ENSSFSPATHQFLIGCFKRNFAFISVFFEQYFTVKSPVSPYLLCLKKIVSLSRLTVTDEIVFPLFHGSLQLRHDG